jgi:hypothetical protein
MLLIFVLSFHFADTLGLELPCHFQKLSDLTPINGSFSVDELFMFMKVTSVMIEKSVHVTVTKFEAKLDRQKIVTDESHQKYKVIDDILYCTSLDSFQLSFEFDTQVLSQDIDKDKLKLRTPCFSVS